MLKMALFWWRSWLCDRGNTSALSGHLSPLWQKDNRESHPRGLGEVTRALCLPPGRQSGLRCLGTWRRMVSWPFVEGGTLMALWLPPRG